MHQRIWKYSIFVFALLILTIQIGIAATNNADLDKIHPKFRNLMTEDSSPAAFRKDKANSPDVYIDRFGSVRYGVIIRGEGISDLQSSGIAVHSNYPGFVTAKLTLDEIGQVSRINSIRYIDAPSINYTKMNVSTPATGASLLHNGVYNETEYTGDGAIVVIFDTGIDFNHIDFKNPADTTSSRILAIWDQTISPISGESNPAGFNYGVEYTQAHINDEIDGSPAGYVRQTDSDGHGTHVAGTAAGSGFKFTGIAPQADIIVVKGGNGSFSEDDIINGITYAGNKASSLGKPVVVNLSLGGHSGPHDGTRAYEEAIDTFSASPGQAVVVAAGNEGSDRIHIGNSIASGGSASFQINVPDYTPNNAAYTDDFLFEIWYDENVSVTAKVTTPGGTSYSMEYNQDGTFLDNEGTIDLYNRRIDGSKQLIRLYVYDSDAGKTPEPGTWKLELLNAGGNLMYDGWLATSDLGGEPALLLNGDVNNTVAMPGTSNDAITVGAYVTKTSWPALNGNQYLYVDDDEFGQIANFSSLGPTRDGRLKPEITAPGKATVSAYSVDSEGDSVIINPDGIHVRSQGTSMAAPHVAGAVAILLSVDATLTASQIKTLMTNTALKDSETGGVANNTWGNGKLDLLKAVVSKVSGDQSVTRSIQEYFIDIPGPYYEFNGYYKLAVRYNAPRAGQLTGAYLSLVINHPDVHPVISGPSNLEVTVHEDNAGLPGTQVGNTVAHSFDLLDPGTKNYINMLDADVTLTEDQVFYLVLETSVPEASIKVLFDDGETERVDNPSFLHNALKGWRPMSEAFSKPYNLRLSAEVVDIGPAASLDERESGIARRFDLEQNYPNPFNPTTTINFTLGEMGQVDLIIFDILGREVIRLVDEVRSVGTHEVKWNSRTKAGYRVPSGVYFYRLRSQEGMLTKKMLLVK